MQPARRRRPAAGGRISTRTSCGECRRRRQRCDQKQPCGRCARRYPQPICHYGEDHELDDVVLPEVSNLIQRETGNRFGIAPHALTVSYGQPTPVRYDDTQAFTKLMELAHRLPGALDDKDNEVLRVYIQLHDQHTSSLSVAREKRDPYQLDIIPMCVQTPLLSQIFIYLGACFLAEIGQLGQTKVYDCKGRAIHHLNEAIRNTQLTAKQEVIVAIILIINNELCYGNTQYLLVHIRGLRETIALCGGLDDLGMNGLLAKMAICSDLCTAFSFEAPPLLQDWQDATSLDAPEISFKWSHNTPLCTTLPDFSVCSELMRIHPTTASILEEMRVLVRLVLDQSRDPTPHKAKKLKSTALWLQNRINEYPEHAPPRDIHTPPPSDIISRSSSRSKSGSPQPIIPIPTTDLPGDPSPDYVYQCARRVSLLFCRAVIRRKPLKDVIQPHDLLALWASMWRVSLDQWGSILGIFVWIQTTTASATQLMPPCAAVKSMFPVSMLQLAQENWSVAKEVFANTLQIHEWLGSGPDDDDAREENSV